MPEEKVSSVQIPKNAGELANNWDKHEKVSDPHRGQWVQRCVTWSFPHQCCIQPLPPAADAGPRCTCSHNYADHSAVRNHYCMMAGCPCERYELLAAPPVPQEAGPDTKWNDEITRDNRFHDPVARATAPDGAMRVAREITTRWQKWQVAYAGNFAGCDTHGGPVPPTEREVAALIREAGSERERELREKLRDEIRVAKSRLTEIGTGSVLDCLNEASRLLGGESK